MKTKEQLSDDIKIKVNEFNQLIKEANELELKVSFKQEFHPLSNAHTNPDKPLYWGFNH